MARSQNVLTWDMALDLTPYLEDPGVTPEWHSVPLRGFGSGGSGEGGLIQAQVVVDEDHEDDLQITSHPVQAGVVVHDHAFKQPATVRCRLGWTNAWAYETDRSNVTALYQKILRLQATRVPFNVYTGKRLYENMLVASLRTHTDQKLEYSLIADIEFREIVLVGTSVGSGVGNPEAQADPQSTMQQSDRGPVQVIATQAMVAHLMGSGIPVEEIVPGEIISP
jgi:hypothetical protein